MSGVSRLQQDAAWKAAPSNIPSITSITRITGARPQTCKPKAADPKTSPKTLLPEADDAADAHHFPFHPCGSPIELRSRALLQRAKVVIRHSRSASWPRPDLHPDATQPATHPSRSFISFPSKFPGMSLHFLPLHCRFSSLHFLEDSFIRIPFPFRSFIFLQLGFFPAPSSFSCNAFDLHFVHFPVTPVSFQPLVSHRQHA